MSSFANTLSNALVRADRALENDKKRRKAMKAGKTAIRQKKAQMKVLRAEYGPVGKLASRMQWGQSWAEAGPDERKNRERYGYYGKGDYKSGMKWLSRGVGGLYGAAAGYMGGGIGGIYDGGRAGYDQGASFSRYMGWGDYGKSSNQIVDGGGGGSQQQISVNQSDLTGDIYYTNTEFVGNVSCTGTGAGASAFQFLKYSLNPGLSATFPFLSQLGQNFTMYEFEGLMFQYKPTSGENNATSNSLGKVILATQYDPDAPDWFNSVQMENYAYANSAKPSCGMIHGVETKSGQQALLMQYVRTGTSAKDKIFTDIGNFYVATEGVPFAAAGTQILGELWVTYGIKLSRPSLFGSLLGNNIQQDEISYIGSAGAMFVSSVAKSTNTLGCTLVAKTAQAMVIKWPVNIVSGSYQVTVWSQWPASAVTNFIGILNKANIDVSMYPFLSAGPGYTGTFAPSSPGAANTQGIIVYFVTVNAPGALQATLDINLAAAATGATTGVVSIQQVPSIVLASIS